MSHRNIHWIIMTAVILVIACGCRHQERDRRLANIAKIVNDSAQTAIRLLDGIDHENLKEDDRHYFELLTVKAKDKAYIPHTSDSLILIAVDYYSSHQKEGCYPEALYYAGRVYSDLGDSPNALRYFRQALHSLSDNDMNNELRSRILSQTGRLLDKIGLREEALTTIDNVIESNILSEDTLDIVYDFQLAGDICLRMDSLERAEWYFKSAFERSKGLESHVRAKSKMYLAAAKYRKKELDSALSLIRSSVDSVSPAAKPTALAYAAKIYHAKGIADTAFMYALQLIHTDTMSCNRHIGYQILLDKDMRHLSAFDSIDSYILAHAEELNRYLDDGRRELAFAQQASYNYSLHEKRRVEAENSRKNMLLWLIASGMAISTLSALIFYLRYRNRDQMLKLKEAIETIDILQSEIKKTESDITRDDISKSEDSFVLSPQNVSGLRSQLREKIFKLSKSAEEKTQSSPLLKTPDLYNKVYAKVKEGKWLPHVDGLWKEIEEAVFSESPEFKNRLTLLSNGEITDDLYRTALLIKCGLSPTEISVLVARGKSAITVRRRKIAKLCFDNNLTVPEIDLLIRFL